MRQIQLTKTLVTTILLSASELEATTKLYNLILDDTDNELNVNAARVIEYASHRLEANEDERSNFDCDTYNMNFIQAVQVIESFNESVEVA